MSTFHLVVERNGAGATTTLLDGTERMTATIGDGAHGEPGDELYIVEVVATSANLTNVVVKFYGARENDTAKGILVASQNVDGTAAATSQTITASAGSTVRKAFATTSLRDFPFRFPSVAATLGGAIGATEIVRIYRATGV